MKKLVLINVLACLLVVFVAGCSQTAGVDPGISAQGQFCAFGVCLTPQAGVRAAAPVVVVPTPAPPVYAQVLPPPVSYNPVPAPVLTRTIEK